MQIVINLPDNMQEMCRWHQDCVCNLTSLEVDILAEAVRNGIVLPKGHDELITKSQAIECIEFYQINPQHFDFVNLINDIKNEKSIIEADREVENDNKSNV